MIDNDDDDKRNFMTFDIFSVMTEKVESSEFND